MKVFPLLVCLPAFVFGRVSQIAVFPDSSSHYLVVEASGGVTTNSGASVSYGDGVYKNEDGGRTWRNVGLKKTEHIARIVIDPKDSNPAPGRLPEWKGGK